MMVDNRRDQRPILDVDGLTCGYHGQPVLQNITLAVAPGRLLCLLGPNGIGKTTLFKTMLRLLPPLAGYIRISGDDTAKWSPRRFAAAVGYVPQAHAAPFPFEVRDVVAMGRAAHLGAFARPARRDYALAQSALREIGADYLACRRYTEISGGERQLVLIARALAQRPSVLIMDEPTSNLDFGNQITVLNRIRGVVREAGIAVVMTSHDPNQALHYADDVAALTRDGRLLTGTPHAIVDSPYLQATYGIGVQRIDAVGLDGGRVPVCLPLPLPQGKDASCDSLRISC